MIPENLTPRPPSREEGGASLRAIRAFAVRPGMRPESPLPTPEERKRLGVRFFDLSIPPDTAQ